MPMISPNKIMGKVKVSPFSGTSTPSSGSPTTSRLKRNLPVLLALLLVGVAIILFLRSRSAGRAGAAVNLISTTAPDQSTIDNLTASILALQGQVHLPSPIPGGGASTPVIPTPSNTPSAEPLWTAGPSYEAMIAQAKATGGTIQQQGQAFDALVTSNANSMWNELARRLRSGESVASAYTAVTGEPPGKTELVLSPEQYLTQKLNQFSGSPQLGNINVSQGYSGALALAQYKHLLSIGPEGYVGVNSGMRDDREYYSVLANAKKYAGIK